MIWITATVIVVVAIGVVAGLAARSPALTMPGTIAGHPRLQDLSTDALEESLASEVGGDAIVGVYGSTLQPVFMVLVLGEAPPPGTDPFERIGDGIAQGVPDATGSIDLEARVTESIGSVHYSCVPFSISMDVGGSFSSMMCDWNDGDTYGLLIGYDPSLDLLDLAPAIHDAVVG